MLTEEFEKLPVPNGLRWTTSRDQPKSSPNCMHATIRGRRRVGFEYATVAAIQGGVNCVLMQLLIPHAK